MKKRTKIFIYCAAFAVAFLVSAIVRIAMLGSAPTVLLFVYPMMPILLPFS